MTIMYAVFNGIVHPSSEDVSGIQETTNYLFHIVHT